MMLAELLLLPSVISHQDISGALFKLLFCRPDLRKLVRIHTIQSAFCHKFLEFYCISLHLFFTGLSSCLPAFFTQRSVSDKKLIRIPEQLDRILSHLVLRRIILRILHCLLNLHIGHPVVGSDRDGLFSSCVQIPGRYLQDAVCIDIKVTSICGTPAGAGLIPFKRNFPMVLLSLAIGRSP